MKYFVGNYDLDTAPLFKKDKARKTVYGWHRFGADGGTVVRRIPNRKR